MSRRGGYCDPRPRLSTTRAIVATPIGHPPPEQVWCQREVNPKSGECRQSGAMLPAPMGCPNPRVGNERLQRGVKDELER